MSHHHFCHMSKILFRHKEKNDRYVSLEPLTVPEIRTCDPSSFAPATSRPCFPSSSQPISTYREHPQAVSCVSVGDRGQRIASASHDGCVKLWSGGVAKSSERTLSHVGDDSWCAVLVHSVVFCDADAGAHVIASGASDGLVRLWDTRLSAPLVRAAAREAGRRRRDRGAPRAARCSSRCRPGSSSQTGRRSRRCSRTGPRAQA